MGLFKALYQAFNENNPKPSAALHYNIECIHVTEVKRVF